MTTEWAWQVENGGLVVALRDRIKTLRKEQGWSQGELAERVGVDAAQISRYESGRVTPAADSIARFAEAFNVSCDYLLIDKAAPRTCAPNT